MLCCGRLQRQGIALPTKAPAAREVSLSPWFPELQLTAELLELHGIQWRYPVLLQPVGQQHPACPAAESSDLAASEHSVALELLEHQFGELCLGVPHVGQSLR